MQWFLGKVTDHHLLDTDSQVARAVARVFHSCQHPGSGTHLQVSQEETANISGVSLQRCNAALGRLQVAVLRKIANSGITITDLEGLRRQVE